MFLLKLSAISSQVVCRQYRSSDEHEKNLKTNSVVSIKADEAILSTDSSKKGFTLIELLVTISIVAILASVGMVVYSSTQKSARISKRLQDLLAIRSAVETYKSSNPSYPVVSAAGVCIGAQTGLASVSGFVPSFMPALPNDPSSQDAATAPCYRYQSDAGGSEYKIWITGTEMVASEYQRQSQYIDPDRDGTADDCIVQSAEAAGWAVYSGSVACNF